MRIRGPIVLEEKDGTCEISVGCRDCGYAMVMTNVKPELVLEEREYALGVAQQHRCRNAEPPR
jgi:hypothetical protein